MYGGKFNRLLPGCAALPRLRAQPTGAGTQRGKTPGARAGCAHKPCAFPPPSLYVTAMSCHFIHPFPCVHLEPPFSGYPTRVHRLTFFFSSHLCSAPEGTLACRDLLPTSLSLAHSGTPLQLTPFPPELLPAGILWQPGQGFPYPWGSIALPLTPPRFKGSGPTLCSERQGWCLGQGFQL